MEKYFAAGFGFLLALLGLYVCVSQLKNFASLKSWETVKGKIAGRRTMVSRRRNVRSLGIRYVPVVEYEYHVAETHFTNNAYYPELMMVLAGSKKSAEKQASDFSGDVVIFYNPQDPRESCLKLPATYAYYIVGIASVIMLLYSVFLLIFGVDSWVGAFNSK